MLTLPRQYGVCGAIQWTHGVDCTRHGPYGIEIQCIAGFIQFRELGFRDFIGSVQLVGDRTGPMCSIGESGFLMIDVHIVGEVRIWQ